MKNIVFTLIHGLNHTVHDRVIVVLAIMIECVPLLFYYKVELREFIKLGRCVYSIEIADDHVNLLPHRDVDSKTESEVSTIILYCISNFYFATIL